MISRKLAHALCNATLVGGLVAVASANDPLTISNVSLSAHKFDAARGEVVSVHFSVTQPARVELNWFDVRDLLVRRVVTQGEVKAGEAVLVWDGRDEAGRQVPNEAYHYTLVAKSRGGERQEFDLTDITGGADVPLPEAKLVPDRSGVRYVLQSWSRVNIRIGMRDGGPLLYSLENWQVRGPGEHLVKWDGFDTSGAINFRESEGIEVWGMSFDLPDNTVLVGDEGESSAVIDPMPWPKVARVRKASPVKRMHSPSQQAFEERGDFPVVLERRGGDTSTIPFEIHIADTVAAHLAQQRFELVYFIDGLFVSENEIGAFPATWNVDVSKLAQGEHLLTVNVRGYEGLFGYGSKKLKIKTAERGTRQ